MLSSILNNPVIEIALKYHEYLALILIIPFCSIMATKARDRQRWEQALAVAVLALPGMIAGQLLVGNLSRLVPMKYDLYVFGFDSWAGNPAFAIGHYFQNHPVLFAISRAAYNNLAVAILLTYIFALRRSASEGLVVIRTLALNLFAGIPFYLLFPVCGPLYAFKDFPNLPPHFTPHLIMLTAPPNGVPSVHTSTALLILWFSRRSRVGFIVASAFVVFIVLATLGSGEHYLFDLILAVPYTFMCLELAKARVKGSTVDQQTELNPQTEQILGD